MATESKALIIPSSQQIQRFIEAPGYIEEISAFDLDSAKVGGVDAMKAPIEGVIVHVQRRRAFYGSLDYHEGQLRVTLNHEAREGTPPACGSLDGITGSGTPGGNCLECPLSEWESAPDSRAQACKDMRFIFVARPGESLPLLVQIPPSSLSAFKKYFAGVFSKGYRLSDVITKISLEPTKNGAGIAFNLAAFEMEGPLQPDQQEEARQYGDLMARVLA